MSKPVIAIVGRPNVGKSTLFNKLIGERRAIVEDTPGVTRDRIYGETEWRGKVLTVIDTGGIEPKTDDVILAHMRMQAEIAIESADVIVFLCDVRTGPTADDREIAVMLKKSRKPVVVAVNKCDSVGSTPPEFYEFYEFGFDTELVALSSVHGTGTGDLLDEILAVLPDDEITEDPEEGIKVAVIGKPNAGKSSLVNRISGAERMIVSNIPGTTRDAIDTRVVNRYGTYTFIDTAGIRRSAKIKDSVEKYSVLRAHTAVERADVCLIMIDAGEGITEQDEKIAGIAHEAGKASVIVVNKWDTVEKDTNTMDEKTAEIRRDLSYMTYAPVVFISALTGQRVDKLFDMIVAVSNQNSMRITTGMLNNILEDATARVQPPTDKGRRLKIYYITQVGVKPPHFVFFCNDSRLFHFSYQRYLENQIRAVFGLTGTPIKITIRQKGDKEDV